MPRKRLGFQPEPARAKASLVQRLVDELRVNREFGQPTIYEQEYGTGKLRVVVTWDEWYGIPLDERSAAILRSYELVEGPEYRDRIALASGLTVSEAYAAGMLPYQIIAALRRTDPLTPEQARLALLEEGASQLASPQGPQLRFATEEEAEASKRRLLDRFPGSDDVWIISRELMAHDLAKVQDWAHASER
jgi:hypothetical protein